MVKETILQYGKPNHNNCLKKDVVITILHNWFTENTTHGIIYLDEKKKNSLIEKILRLAKK
jgi:hypothetical protein